MIGLEELNAMTALLTEPDRRTIEHDGSIVAKYLWKDSGHKVAVQVMAIERGLSLPVNFRDELEILAIYEGDLQIDMGGEKTKYSRGEVAIIPAEKAHLCRAITNVKLIAISIPASEEYPDE